MNYFNLKNCYTLAYSYEFKDSYSFLGFSLSNLCDNLLQSGCSFNLLKQSALSRDSTGNLNDEFFQFNKIGKGMYV